MAAIAAFRRQIACRLSQVTAINTESIAGALTWSRNEKDGDLSIAVPSLLASATTAMKDRGTHSGLVSGISPAQVAVRLADEYNSAPIPNGNTADTAQDGPVVSHEGAITVSAKDIFLNFSFRTDILVREVLKDVHTNTDTYGRSCVFAGKRAVVEFSSPNIAKPFHAGHLRSTVLGSFISRILTFNGYDSVRRINYLGDWGKQYGLLAVGYELYGCDEKLAENAIQHLYEIYVEVNKRAKETPDIDGRARAYFRRLEEGDPAALALWDKLRQMSITEYAKVYERLGVQFDVFEGESMADGDSVVKSLRTTGTSHYQEDGSEVCDLSDEGNGTCVVKKSDGAALYITRDIAMARQRYEHSKFDRMYYVVATQQDHHFKQLFQLLHRLGYDWANKCEHIAFGMVKGMSTRKGDVVFLEQILDEARDRMMSRINDDPIRMSHMENPTMTAEQLGLSAVVVQDLMARRLKDYAFSWDRILKSEGDTGVYIQYTHARLCGIRDVFTPRPGEPLHAVDVTKLVEPSAVALVKQIARFQEVTELAGRNLEPSTLVQYMLKVCHLVGACHESLYVKNQERDIALARYAMYEAARIVLSKSIALIGLRPLEKV